MVFRGTHYLRKLFPEIDWDVPGNQMQGDYLDQNEVLNLLLDYFNNKKNKCRFTISEHALKKEAKYIHKLFPNFERNYIFDQLNLFNDMPDRIEIVLRMLVNLVAENRESNLVIGHKRNHSNIYLENAENDNQIPHKLRKVELKNIQNYNTPTDLDAISSVPLETVNNNADVNIIEKNENNSYLNPDCTFEQGSSNLNGEQINSNEVSDSDLEFISNSLFGNPQNPPSFIHEGCIGNPTIKTVIDYAKVSTLSNEFSEITEDLQKPLLTDFQIMQNKLRPVSEDYLNKTLDMCDNTENPTTSKIDDNCYYNILTWQQRTGKPSTITSENNNSNEIANFTHLVPILNEPAVQCTSSISLPQNPPEVISKTSVIVSGTNITSTVVGIPVVTNPIVNKLDNLQDSSTETVFDTDHSSSELSTSETVDMPRKKNDGADYFDLFQHLRELTNAPPRFIRNECRKLGVRFDVRPSPTVMNLLIENLLENYLDDSNDSSDSLTLVEENEYEVNDDGASPSLPATTTSNVEISTATNVVDSTLPDGFSSVPEPQPVIESNITTTINSQLVNHLCSIFPEACPNYIKGLCKNKPMSNEVLDALITVILDSDSNYPKRPPPNIQPEIFPENQLDILKEFLPDADPDYLQMKFDSFGGKPEKVKAFINEAMEVKNYPKMKDYLRRQQLSAQQKQYTTEFTVDNFIKVIPDPEKLFFDPTRVIKMDDASSHYALVFLRNTFNKLHVRTIQSIFSKNHGKLSIIFKALEEISKIPSSVMKSKRKAMEMPKNIQNIPLLQEIAYYMHKAEITSYLEQIAHKEETERKEAINNGSIKKCNCCYDEEVLPKDIFMCENGCEFCKSCIVTATEVRFGEGKLDFPCLMNCESQFSLSTLQAVLSPKLFSKIAQKKTVEEVKSAGIEELEFCPFCDFATIPAEGYTVFTCLNPDCMKESCRSCKEPSHIPLRCDEIEKDEEVKARTYVENKMTDALLRKCWKCGVKFFKEEGCNKMTCSCGAQMCYLCEKPVTSYKHFNGNGGDRTDLCPLYSDAISLNEENVLKGALSAKAELGVDQLKHDPAADVQQHYKERARKNPQQQYLQPPLANPIQQLVFLWNQGGHM